MKAQSLWPPDLILTVQLLGEKSGFSSWPVSIAQERIQMRLHRRPFAGDYTIDTSVAEGSIRCELMAAQDSVELCTEPFDRAAALMVEVVISEIDGISVQGLKCMTE
jgi:hypothetical protein